MVAHPARCRHRNDGGFAPALADRAELATNAALLACISSIRLLKTFIEVGDLSARGSTPSAGKESVTDEVYTWDGVLWQVIIHMVFIVSAIALAWIDRMSQPAGHAPAISAPAGGPALPAGSAPHLALGAPHPAHPALGTAAAGHLLQLGALRDAGVVTEVEFETKKSELLARL